MPHVDGVSVTITCSPFEIETLRVRLDVDEPQASAQVPQAFELRDVRAIVKGSAGGYIASWDAEKRKEIFPLGVPQQ